MSDQAFECQPYDADMPSGTVRFYVPRDFPLAGGVFEIRRVRTATDADRKVFSDRPDPPEPAFSDCRRCNGE